MQTAGGPASTTVTGFTSGPRTAAIGLYATIVGWLAVLALLLSLILRTIATGHGPFANMYEFSVAFAFGILLAYMLFERRYHQRILALIALPVALAMMLYAFVVSLSGAPTSSRSSRPCRTTSCSPSTSPSPSSPMAASPSPSRPRCSTWSRRTRPRPS